MKGKAEGRRLTISRRDLVAHGGREEALDEIVSLLELAIARIRAHRHADQELKALIRGALESARQELIHLKATSEDSGEGRTAENHLAKTDEHHGLAKGGIL